MSTQMMAYSRKLSNWDTKASVRVKPRRILLQDEEEMEKVFFSHDVKRQVFAATSLVPDFHGSPRFLRQLRALQRDLPRELNLLSELLFTVVSETLISTILAQIPKDDRVVTAVRNIVADHAE